jgi:wyosine [tRNA(Phe)-imidazoG37] synthetase (radical SAM superfamily)
VYCEVDRAVPVIGSSPDMDVMAEELQRTLELVSAGKLHHLEHYRNTPAELLEIRHVALSGDGEPTLCPHFLDAVRTVAHVRALGRFPFFKIVLITNSAGLDLPDVQKGLKLFTGADEVWAKLDAGTQVFMDKVNRTDCRLEKILANILLVARKRPVIVQSLFSRWNDDEPPAGEIEEYALRLRELKEAGAQIPLVQIYSATRPTPHSDCGHLPLKALAKIAERVREVSGLRAEVF